MVSHSLTRIFSQRFFSCFSPWFSAFLTQISFSNVIKQLVHAFSVSKSSYGCTWEVWRALRKLELLSATPWATLTLLSCSPNFPCASITWYTHAKHEPIANFPMSIPNPFTWESPPPWEIKHFFPYGNQLVQDYMSRVNASNAYKRRKIKIFLPFHNAHTPILSCMRFIIVFFKKTWLIGL